MIRSVWAFRYFILSSIRNDLRVRFVRSKLGALWMIIHPLMQVLIFATILSEVLAAKLPGVNNKFAYALYLMAGTLCWTLFAECIGKCASLFVDNGNLMKKQAFPGSVFRSLPAVPSWSTTCCCSWRSSSFLPSWVIPWGRRQAGSAVDAADAGICDVDRIAARGFQCVRTGHWAGGASRPAGVVLGDAYRLHH